MAPPQGEGGSEGSSEGGESGPPLNKPPNSAAAANAKEPYPDEQAVENAVAPTPGAPTAGDNNVLTMFVPTETTVLQMGAASAGPSPNVPAQPGFRVSTEHHAHLTAQTPLTTISMGAPGGEGMGGVPGLSIFSAAKKDERIVQAVTATYGDTFTEEITGNVTCEYKSNVEINITGDKKEEVLGDQIFHIANTEHKETGGLTVETFIGVKNEIDVGGKTEITLGAALEIFAGGSMEVFKGYKRELMLGTSTGAQNGNKTEIQRGDSTEYQFGTKTEAALGNSTGERMGNSNEKQCGDKEEKQLGNKRDTLIGNSVEEQIGRAQIFYTLEEHKAELKKEQVETLTTEVKATVWSVGATFIFK